MVTLPTKIVLDSRDAAQGSSHAFRYSLPEMLHMPADTAMYVTSCSLGHTFLSTGTSVGTKSHYVYFFERLRGSETILNRAALQERSYDAEELSAGLQQAMNDVSWFGSSPYTCTYDVSTQSIVISKSVDANSFFMANDGLLLTPGIRAYVLPRTALFAEWDIDYDNLESAMGLVGLGKGSSVNKSLVEFVTAYIGADLNYSMRTGAIDTRRGHNVYIHSQALSSYHVIGPAGARTCIAKNPITSQPGSVLHYAHSGHHYDYIDVSHNTLYTIDISCTEYRQDPIDLRGATLSIELMFAQTPF